MAAAGEAHERRFKAQVVFDCGARFMQIAPIGIGAGVHLLVIVRVRVDSHLISGIPNVFYVFKLGLVAFHEPGCFHAVGIQDFQNAVCVGRRAVVECEIHGFRTGLDIVCAGAGGAALLGAAFVCDRKVSGLRFLGSLFFGRIY